MDILETMKQLLKEGVPRDQAWKEIKKSVNVTPHVQDRINRQLDLEEQFQRVVDEVERY